MTIVRQQGHNSVCHRLGSHGVEFNFLMKKNDIIEIRKYMTVVKPVLQRHMNEFRSC